VHAHRVDEGEFAVARRELRAAWPNNTPSRTHVKLVTLADFYA
jgi:hypothetical protein